jgi:D-arabinose 5-phosphate isomerase GutQ
MSAGVAPLSPVESSALAAAREQVRGEGRLLAEMEPLVDERLVAAARIVLAHRGKVIPTGVGTSGEIARRMAHLLSVAGTPSLFLHPTNGLHGSLGAVTPDDVVIAISKGGQSEEVNEFARRARARGAAVVVLTARQDSELAGLGDLAVVLPAPDYADPAGVIAMGSTLAVAAWGDALAVLLMQLRGYRWDEVLFTHPGGAVGRRAEAGEPARVAGEDERA